MLDPAEMKNKGEVIASIHNAQTLFEEAPTIFEKRITRATLEAVLLTYVDRYRNTNIGDAVLVREAEATKPPTRGFVPFECPRCDGTGLHPLGSCYRCTNGIQTEDDQKRNYGYDLHHPSNKSRKQVFIAKAVEAKQQAATQLPTTVAIEIGDTTPDFDEDDLPF